VTRDSWMERTGSQIKAFWDLRSFDCTPYFALNDRATQGKQDRCATIKNF